MTAKAHKLFGNKKPLDDGSRQDHEQNGELQANVDSQEPKTFFAEDTEPNVAIEASPNNNFAVTSHDEEEGDDEEVGLFTT